MTNKPRRLTNICFHGIGHLEREREPGESGYWVTEGTFHGILDLARDRSDVALSFDDGNASDIETGLPGLTERGLTATFFPIAARLDEPRSLSRSDLRALVDAGMSVGSHGMHHRPWRGLRAAEQVAEFDEARRVIQDVTGRAVDAAACPLGIYDRTTLLALRRRGYRTVMTSDRSRARAGAWLQPRYSVRADDTVESIASILDRAPTPAEALLSRARIAAKSLR